MEKSNISFEPMDIDLSSQSVKEMDVSYDDSDIDIKPILRPPSRIRFSPSLEQLRNPEVEFYSTTVKQPVVKKYHINLQKTPKSNTKLLFKILTAVSIVVFSIFTYHVHSLKCCDDIDLDLLNDTLSKNVIGQSAAVGVLMDSLNLKSRSKLLFFTGGTGVGKSFTSSLLLDIVGSCSNVYHYTMPTFETTFSTDLMFGLTICKTSLVIVDDLTISDASAKEHIKNLIEKSEFLEKEITVILIFHCKDDRKGLATRSCAGFNHELFEMFSDIKALKRFIVFERLSENHLKECIKQELGERKLTEQEFEDVLKNFNVSVDGCKGVHSKMKYLNIV